MVTKKKTTKVTTRKRGKRNIALELPGVLMGAIGEYLGPTMINRLTTEQSRNLMVMAADTASDVVDIINAPPETEEGEQKPQ